MAFEYWIYWLSSNNTTESLNITDKVIRDEYPLNVIQSANLVNEAEGTIKVIDKDGTIEKILLGISEYNPTGGAVRLEIKEGGQTKYTYWTTGKFRRNREILELEYSSEKRALLPKENQYKIADANRLLQILYGLSTCSSKTICSNSTRLLLKVYAGVDIPENLEPHEISWLRNGNTLYVLYRNILVKYNVVEVPYRIDAVLDISTIVSQNERITVSSLIQAQEDTDIAGRIVGLNGTSIEVILNIATTDSNQTFNCFKVFTISSNLTSWTSGPFLVKKTDINAIPFPSYSFVAKVGSACAFLFKGYTNGTLIISDGTRYYSSVVSMPANEVIRMITKGFSYLDSYGIYNLFILGIRTLWLKVNITTNGINVSTQSYVDIPFQNEVESIWDGYISPDNTYILYVAIRKTDLTETGQFGKITIGSSTITSQTFRTLSNYPTGSIKGYGFDSYYRVADVYITYNDSGVNRTKRFETGYTGTTNDVEFAVYLNHAHIIRAEDIGIYFNTGTNKGGVGVIGNSANLYMTDWTDDVFDVVPFGFLLNHQIITWSEALSSSITLDRSKYFNSKLVEGREYDAHKRLIIQTVDGETIIETSQSWAYVDNLVSLPVTGEMARTLLLMRNAYKKIKHYKVESKEDITEALAKKFAFTDPEGRPQDAYLLGYTQNTDGIFTYDIYVTTPAGDISWDIPEDYPSYLVLDTSFSHSFTERGTSYEYVVKVQYISQGIENPTRIRYSVIDMVKNENVYSGWSPLSGGRTGVYNIRFNYVYLSNFSVIVTFSSRSSSKIYTHNINLVQTNQPKTTNLKNLEDYTKNPIYLNPNSNFTEGLSHWISDSGSTILVSGQNIITDDYYPILLKENDNEHFILNVAVKIRSNINARLKLLVYFYDEDYNPVGNHYEDSLYFTQDYVVEKQTKTVEMDINSSGLKYFRVAVKNVSYYPIDDDIEVVEFGIYYDFVAYDSVKLGGRYYTDYALTSHTHDERYLLKNQSGTLSGDLTVTGNLLATLFFGNILTAEPTPDPGKVIFYAYNDGNYVRVKVAFNYQGTVVRYIIYSWLIP